MDAVRRCAVARDHDGGKCTEEALKYDVTTSRTGAARRAEADALSRRLQL